MAVSLDSGRTVQTAENGLFDRSRTICFTGHREKSIADYRNNPHLRLHTLAAVRLMLYRYIDMAVESGYDTFISGLAEGTDLWAADYVLCLKKSNPNIRLIGVMPYLKHSKYFSPSYRETLKNAELNADLLLSTEMNPDMVYGSAAYTNRSPDLYRRRNYFMADNSSAVIAFFNTDSFRSGTAQTVSYAKRCGLPVYRFGTDEVFSAMDSADGDDIHCIRQKIMSLPNVILPCR